MLKSFFLSRAVKMAATCVCPVVGTGVLTMAVPPVRHAVHHLTAPKEAALPRTRLRPAVATPCPPGAAVAVPAVGGPIPLSVATPAAVTQIAGNGPVGVPGPFVPVSPISLTPGDLGPPTTSVAPLPEARTWLQLVVGFGMIGGSTRMAQAKLRAPTMS